MVRKRLIVATILAIAAVAFASTTLVDGALGSPPQTRPSIVSAELRGNNLMVEGANFDENATVYINYKKRETIPDAESQGKVLMVRKGGKRIRFDDYSTVYVSNGDGQTSNGIRLFRTDAFVARLIQFPVQPELGLIHLKVGGYLLVDSRAALSADGYDRDFFARAGDQRFDTDDLRLYQVLREGDTGFVISQVPFPNGGPQPPPIIWGLTIHAE